MLPKCRLEQALADYERRMHKEVSLPFFEVRALQVAAQVVIRAQRPEKRSRTAARLQWRLERERRF